MELELGTTNENENQRNPKEEYAQDEQLAIN